MGLTAAQYDFVLRYAESFNGRHAYLASHPGVKNETADTEASTTLRLPKVRAFLRQVLEGQWGGLEATAEETLGRLGAVSRADPALLFDEKHQLLPVRQWPAPLRLALKSYDPGGKVAFLDRLAVWRLVLEVTGKLKNPVSEAADILAAAIKADRSRLEGK